MELAVAPVEADDAEAPRVMFVPVARKEDRTVSSVPSTTVLFKPDSPLYVYDFPVLVPGAEVALKQDMVTDSKLA